MSVPTPIVGAKFGVANDGEFIVGDAVRGVVGSDYVIGTGYSTVSEHVEMVTITRGRWAQLTDVFDAADASVTFANYSRELDPTYPSSPFYGRTVPGAAFRVQAQADGYAPRSLVTGVVDGWDFAYDTTGRSVAIARGTDALGMLGGDEFDAWTSYGTTAAQKLTDACNRPEVAWPSWLRDFDGGEEALQSDAVSWGSNVLNYMQLIARSEIGYLFATGDGVLTFRDRRVAVGVSPAVAFGGDSGVPIHTIAAKYGETLYSRVGVDREGGTNQTVEVADLDAWKERYGAPRSLRLPDLLLASDAQSEALAEYLLSLYDSPRYQISEIGVELAALTAAQQDAVLALEIGDVVSAEFTPNDTGDPIVQTVVVQGIAHQMVPSSHVVRLSLIAAPFPWFRVGDPVYGVVGVGVIGF